jgi:hypothetical protein
MSTRYLDQVAWRRVDEAREQASRASRTAESGRRRSDTSRVARLAARVAARRERAAA